ncbi:hypothetical protein FHR81_003107 [Actinoalloteichus hoggarensis]|uniref:Uncharacterized protein n=1 Tax=Actinoalloteichus hoggarensis TaxID=1470176 RepID=A0A221W744_9PSEU|nr:hypothetical protein AHOG_19220 [Actinoalloteichus hoggarensis]MBB5922055.1 hypothetical protein [Actinoalloteichus hoggarensis]
MGGSGAAPAHLLINDSWMPPRRPGAADGDTAAVAAPASNPPVANLL